MKKTQLILWTTIGIIVGAVGGGLTVFQVLGRFYSNGMDMMFAGDANMTIGALRPLRAGDTTNAIELLEIKLDGALIGLGAALEDRPQARRDPLQLKVLNNARDYRSKFLRKSHSPELDEAVAKVFVLLDE